MYNIIPLLLILICLSVIIVIVSRKFSVLASLDVANIPAEKEARFKERIVSNRLKRNIIKWLSRLSRLTAPMLEALNELLKVNLLKLYQLKNDYKTAVTAGAADGQKVEQLFIQAEEFKKSGDLEAAENKYIEIIGQDARNVNAFKELARVYFEKKQFEEARQTFEHILKLKEDDEMESAQTYWSLASVYEAMSQWPQAVKSLKKALKIEPANPRYLDTMLQISIIIKDKALALDTYQKLFKTNPENQKLAELKQQIDEL